MWVLIFTLVILGCEAVYIIKYVTRFTEEIFAFLIACVFLADAFKKLVQVKNLIVLSNDCLMIKRSNRKILFSFRFSLWIPFIQRKNIVNNATITQQQHVLILQNYVHFTRTKIKFWIKNTKKQTLHFYL